MRVNYGVFCPLVNLTTINRQTNVALIRIQAAPDHYSSLVYIVYIYSGSAIGVERWVGHAVANILETMYRSMTFADGSMTLATVTNNHNTTPNF